MPPKPTRKPAPEALDELAGEIQADQDQQIRETYGETVWQRWRHPARMGEVADANGRGRVTGTCGDTMRIFVRVEDGVVRDAGFLTDGCGTSQVCGSMAADMAVGKTVDQLDGLDGRTILDALGGLPDDDSHCAFLAANALHEALADYHTSSKKYQGERP